MCAAVDMFIMLMEEALAWVMLYTWTLSFHFVFTWYYSFFQVLFLSYVRCLLALLAILPLIPFFISMLEGEGHSKSIQLYLMKIRKFSLYIFSVISRHGSTLASMRPRDFINFGLQFLKVVRNTSNYS